MFAPGVFATGVFGVNHFPPGLDAVVQSQPEIQTGAFVGRPAKKLARPQQKVDRLKQLRLKHLDDLLDARKERQRLLILREDEEIIQLCAAFLEIIDEDNDGEIRVIID